MSINDTRAAADGHRTQSTPLPAEATMGLWRGDTGTLSEASRRVLLELLKGPYVSGTQSPGLWAALAADETQIRSRLHDLFLDLVLDPVDEFAFTRKVDTHEIQAPSALRSERLTFLDTAMLLVLRQLMLAAPGESRVIVGQDEVYDLLGVYRDGDEATFKRNLNGSWSRMINKLRILHTVDDDRAQISPMIRFLVDEDRVRELTEVYRRIAEERTAARAEETAAEAGAGGETVPRTAAADTVAEAASAAAPVPEPAAHTEENA
ncbi:DUF4194 domain-containing protein [Brevibacterium album]|uniref:DUF4194 domain-containing protein n=1 Tax=Brevibacterium album TaxID=417948 RepID=UPI000411FF8E|nr:DUF4194 domain-containing protein [Brevibacterium album]